MIALNAMTFAMFVGSAIVRSSEARDSETTEFSDILFRLGLAGLTAWLMWH